MALRIAILGGIPPSLGGGGLEVQIRESMSALGRRGHSVFHVAAEATARSFDILHAFGSEPDVCHVLSHWRINPAPLVISPVLVVPPRRESLERLAARMPLASLTAHARLQTLRQATHVIAQTRYESRFLAKLGVPTSAVIPNGVHPVEPSRVPNGTPESGSYLLMLGAVSARKRQTETLRFLRDVPVVIVGGFTGSPTERAQLEGALAQAPFAVWLDHVDDPRQVRALLEGARALVHPSSAEGQPLAVLEALSVGTPVIAARLPSTLELASEYPGRVRIVKSIRAIPGEVDRLPPRSTSGRTVPTWDVVAERLERVYAEAFSQSQSRSRGR